MKKHSAIIAGILSLMLVFGFALTGCDNGSGDDGGSGSNTGGNGDNTGGNGDNTGGNGDNTGDNTANGKSVTVNMQKPANWQQLYVYAWDDSGTEYAGAAPGKELTSPSGGFYSYNVPSAEYGYINVRYSDGGSKSTLDIQGVESNTYFTGGGAYTGDSSKILLAASSTGSFSSPTFTGIPTTTTVTLNWSFIPDADAYVLYDKFVAWGDDPSDDRYWWHLQKALPREQTSLLDDNYGEYIEPETSYTWKLVAVKWNENTDLTGIAGKAEEDLEEGEISELDEQKFSSNYTVIHDFGEIPVTTLKGTLPAPGGLKILDEELSPASVALQWNPVAEADYYMVWWWNDGSDGRDEDWYYIEAAFDTSYVDADEEFIFPSSTYKYKVEARADDHGDGPLYGKWSNAVTVTTPAEPAASLAYGGASSIARAASKAKITPAPSAPTLSISAKGVVTVSIANDSSKSRKFDIYLSNGNPLDTVSGGKATLTKELKNLQAGSSVAIKVQEVPYGANTNYKYSTNLYNTASDFSSLAYIVVPPKLEAFAAPTGTTGKGSNTVKSFTVTVKGWPSSGAASHTYAIKASSGTQQPSGKWVGDTYTGTIKTANKVSFTITPILSGNKTQTPLTTAKI